MKCPFKFNSQCCDVDESCDADCALLLKVVKHSDDGKYHGSACSFAVLASDVDDDIEIACRVDDIRFKERKKHDVYWEQDADYGGDLIFRACCEDCDSKSEWNRSEPAALEELEKMECK